MSLTIASTRSAAVAFRTFDVAVRRVTRLSENFVRVTFASESLVDFHAAGLDQRVKIAFPVAETGLATFPRSGDDWYTDWRALPDAERCPMRTYTVRAFRRDSLEIDVDFVTHGDSGPATRWVSRATPGDEVVIVGPDERTVDPGRAPVAGVEFRPGDARRILLAGDETAAPAICSIVESLAADARGQVFIEVPTAGDILRLEAPAGVSVTWLPRDDRDQYVTGSTLDRAVRAWVREMVVAPAPVTAAGELTDELEVLWDVPDAGARHVDIYAWVAGEASCVTGIRRFLVRDSGLDKGDVAFMGYWRAGRSEN